MGWASGSSLFSNIIEALVETDIDEDTRELIYEALIPCFEDRDCDTLMECIGEDKAFDRAYKNLNPDYDMDDEELIDWDDEDEEIGRAHV